MIKEDYSSLVVKSVESIVRLRVDSFRKYVPALVLDNYLERRIKRTIALGVVDLPIDSFVSSRWHPFRTGLPLAYDYNTWRFAWHFWREAKTYKAIKRSIEQNGLTHAIAADWFVNYDPRLEPIAHRAFIFHGKAPRWPMFVLRTGNERLMMAWFEWGWASIPVSLRLRDCGFCPKMSEFFKLIGMFFRFASHAGATKIFRKIDQIGCFKKE